MNITPFHKKISVVFMLISTLFLTASPAFAKTAVKPKPVPPPHYTRLFYYTGGDKAQKSFMAHASSIDVFAPQTYAIDGNAQLVGSVNADMLAFAGRNSIKVIPLITNGSFSQAEYQNLLVDVNKQNTLIGMMVVEAKQHGYDGWQFDFEQMDASYKDQFSAFVARAHAMMKQNGLSLSVAVVAKISDNPSDYPNNLWQKLIGVYDFDALGANTDFISVMSYDDPYSKGPVVGYEWLQKVISYSMLHIPKEKISLGLPFYYWQWDVDTGKRTDIGVSSNIEKLAQKHKLAYFYDPTEHAPYLVYKNKGKDTIVWYENQKSIAAKIALVRKYGLAGTSSWALGQELASVYTAFKE